MLNVLVSQQWLFTGLRPAADYLIARTAPVVPGVRVKAVSTPVRGEWVWAPEAGHGPRPGWSWSCTAAAT